MGDLDKLIVAKGFKKLPKVQNFAQSGHTGLGPSSYFLSLSLYTHSTRELENTHFIIFLHLFLNDRHTFTRPVPH